MKISTGGFLRLFFWGLVIFPGIAFGQAPTITSFSPASGAVGTLVTITGTNVSNPTTFTIGGVPAISISNSSTQLVGMVMPGAVTGGLSITTADGTVNSAGNFMVTPTLYPTTQQGSKLVGTGAIGAAQQGIAVSVSADGNTAIVGGDADNSNLGAAWIYTRSGSTWAQQGKKLVGTGTVETYSSQGQSVAISADGNTAIVGGPSDGFSGEGAAWIFTRNGSTWAQQGPKLAATGGEGAVGLGKSVAISADGNTAIVGGDGDNANLGAVWIYTRSGGAWAQQGGKLVGTGAAGPAQQGYSVSLSADGNTAIVGGAFDNSSEGAIWVFTRSGSSWTQQGPKLVGTGGVNPSQQGFSTSISADGNTAIVGGYQDNNNLGAVWIYARSAGSWTQQGAKLVGTGGEGLSVSISADGNTAIAGGIGNNSGVGMVWRYTRSGGTWSQQGVTLLGTGNIGAAGEGYSVSLSSDASTTIVGGPNDNTYKGAAWAFGSSPVSALAFSAIPAKIYGAADFSPGATSSKPITYTSSNTNVATIVSGNIHIVGAGTSTITANDGTSTLTQTLTVTGAALTITSNNQNKTYGAAMPTLTVTYSGFVNGESQANLTTAPTIVTPGTTASPAGTYAITALGAVDPNYTISYVSGTLTVGQAALNITADNQNKTYGANNPILTATYTGFVNSDSQASLATLPDISTIAASSSPVGNYAITASGAVDPNYAITYFTGTLTVAQAPLTITADNQSRAYGVTNPTLTATYIGFVNGDTQASLTTPPVISTTAIASSPLGNYPISVSGAVDPNYTISYASGTLTVTGTGSLEFAPLPTTMYGFSDFNPAATSSNPITYSSSNTSVATIVSGNVHIVGAGTSTITATSGGTSLTQTLTVTQAALNITANNQTKLYGSANPTLTASYTGFVNGDSPSSLTTQPTISTTAVTTSLPGPYPITASGAADNNYVITYAAGTLTVDPSTSATLSSLALSAGALTPAFAATTQTYTATVGNAVTSVTITPVVNSTVATVTVNGSTVASGAASNVIMLNVGSNVITTVVTAQDGVTTQTYTITVNRAALPPVITSISPSSGPVGTLVTVTGANLGSLTAFTIGGVTAISISNTGTQLVGMVMPGASTGTVAVTTSGGMFNSAGNFTLTATPYPNTQQGPKQVGTGAVGPGSVGYAVSVSADGNTAIVGGPNDNLEAGAAWIFTRSGGIWTQQGAKLVGTGAIAAQQGASVAISADGNTAIVGGPADNSGVGACWVYVRSGSTWTQQGVKLIGTGATGVAQQSNSVSISADGNTIIIGSYNDGGSPSLNSGVGAFWIFTRSGGVWLQQGPKYRGTGSVGNAGEGYRVALSADGNTAIIGAPYDNSNIGAVWIFTRSANSWVQQGAKLVGAGATGGPLGAPLQGSSVALSADGNTALVGAWYDGAIVGESGNAIVGAAWVYTRNGNTWAQQGNKLVGTGSTGDTRQGWSAALSADGNTALVGGNNVSNAGAMWVYTRSAGLWTQQGAKPLGATALEAPNEGVPVAISADGSTGLIGAPGDNSVTGAVWPYFSSASPTPVIPPAPIITYTTPHADTINTATAALNPTNTGGAVPATVYGQISTFAGSGIFGFLNGTGTAAKFNTPTGIATDIAGNIYVADYGNNVIRKITPAGVVTTLAGSGVIGSKDSTGTGASFHFPAGVATDVAGNVYVADQSNNLIRKITSAGVVTTLAGSGVPGAVNGTGTTASFNNPDGVATDTAGNVYVADFTNNLIRKITPAGVVTTLAGSGTPGATNGTGTAASFNAPFSVATDAAGNVYVADRQNNLIRKITPGGVVTTLAGSGVHGAANGTGTAASFGAPNGVATDAAGNVYVAEYDNNDIRKITHAGVVTTIAGSDTSGSANGIGAAASFKTPYGVAGDASGYIYVADADNALIRKISVAGYAISPDLPTGLSFDRTTGMVSGTPTVTSPAKNYTITGYNTGGSSAAVMSLAVLNQQVITFPVLNNVAYGSGDTTPGATASSGLQVTYTSSNTNVATITPGGNIHIVGAGNTMITASQSGDSVYFAASPVSQTLTVNQAVLTIIADNQNKVYGSGNPTLTATYTGFVNGDGPGSLTKMPVISTTATVSSPVGTYPITASGAVNPNYSITYTAGTLTIGQATLMIAADNQTKTYGSANPTLTITYSGFVNGDGETSLVTLPDINTTATVVSSVGTYPITVSGAVDPNYSISYTSGTLTVGQAALLVTADDQDKTYGSANPAFTATYSGFVNGDSQSSLTTLATINTTATVASSVGTYPITASGAVDPNYSISYAAGTLTVDQATLTITADNQSKLYSDDNPALTASYAGFVNGDTQANLLTQPTESTTATESSPVGDYPISVSGASASNYAINYVAGTLTVNPAPAPTITAFSPGTAIAGSTITLTGTYLLGATNVTFGDTPAASFTANSPTSITAIVGNGDSGNVIVTTPTGAGALDGFNFVPVPTITAGGPTTILSDGSGVLLTASPGSGFAYQWMNNGAAINGATDATYTALQTGQYTVSISLNGVSQSSASTAVTSVFDLPPSNFQLTITSETCDGTSDGFINIKAVQALNYTATITGNGLNKSYAFTDTATINDLAAGTYNVCITVAGQTGYENCYNVTVTQPQPLSVYTSVNSSAKTISLALSGGTEYLIELDGKQYTTTNNTITLPLRTGNNDLKVTTDKICQGSFEKLVNASGTISVYPVPFQNELNIDIGNTTVNKALVEIFDTTLGKRVYTNLFLNQSGVLQLDLSDLGIGVYGLYVTLDGSKSIFKIIK